MSQNRTLALRGFSPQHIESALALRYELWQDRAWDRRHRVNTREITYLKDLTVVGLNASLGVEHDPSPVRYTRRLLDAMPVTYDETLVDFGSGRGRLLLLAAERFKRVIGVEFAKELVETSKRNVNSFRGALRCQPEVQLQDAIHFEIPSDDNLVLWFYAPFKAPVMTQVLKNIARSYEANPRNLSIMYCNPFHRDLFDQQDWLVEQPLRVRNGLFKDRLQHVFYRSK